MMQPSELKAIRDSRNMTQQAFADAVGMSRKVVNEMEAGTAPITARAERAALAVADGGDLLVRVGVAEMGDKFVVMVTERVQGDIPGRSHRIHGRPTSRQVAVATAKDLAAELGTQFVSTIR